MPIGLNASTAHARLQQGALAHPDKTLLITPAARRTYAEFYGLVTRRAAGFRELGIKPGEPVCQMLPNCEDFLVNWLALSMVGAIEVGISTEFSGTTLARLLNKVKSTVLIYDPIFETTLGHIASQLDHVTTVITRGEANHAPGVELERFSHLSLESVEGESSEDPATEVDYKDPLMLICTSGTTGPSKLVEYSHGFALHYANELIEHVGLREDDILYSAYPLYHTEASVLTFLAAVHCGAQAVIMPKFSASRFWDDIRAYGVTYTSIMGAVMTILAKQPPQSNDRDNPLRTAIAAPTPAFWRDFEKRFDVKVMETYGATECCQPIWDPLDGEHTDGACGRPCEHHEVRVADDDDFALPTGDVGEILVRPKQPYTSMTGYYNDPEATCSAWRNLWYHTGDLGFFDDRGFLHWTGRKGDRIRRRGENISAYEVEEVLNEHPAVMESAVIGVPSGMTEEDVKVVLLLKGGQEVVPQEFLAWARGRVPKYALPRYIETVDELPKSETSKVQKAKLRENWQTGTTFDTETDSFLAVTPGGS